MPGGPQTRVCLGAPKEANPPLQESHAKILSIGLSFVTCKFALAIDKLIRTHKIKTTFITFNKSKDKKFKTPSRYSPPPKTYPPELDELHIILKQELRKLPGNVRIKDNLTKADRLALKELSNRSDLVIKKADKGSSIVVMDREDYIFEAERQLGVSKHYKQIDEPQFPKNCEIFNQILNEMRLKKLISMKEYNFLRTSRDSRERIFYLLPKIHKEAHKGTVAKKNPPGCPNCERCPPRKLCLTPVIHQKHLRFFG